MTSKRGSKSEELPREPQAAEPQDLLSWSTPEDHKAEMEQMMSLWRRAAWRPLTCRPTVDLSQREFFHGGFRVYTMLRLNPQSISMRVPFLRPHLLHITVVYLDSRVRVPQEVLETVRHAVQGVLDALIGDIWWIQLDRDTGKSWNFSIDDGAKEICKTLKIVAQHIFVSRRFSNFHERDLHVSWL